MMSEETQNLFMTTMEFMAILFIFLAGLAVLAIIIIFIIDVTQTKSAIRRNYPVVGHFRYYFKYLSNPTLRNSRRSPCHGVLFWLHGLDVVKRD